MQQCFLTSPVVADLPEASIFTAELYAINAAMHEILKGTIEGNRFTIFSD